MKTLQKLVQEFQEKYKDTNIITYRKNNPHTWGIYYRTSFGDFLICSAPANNVLMRRDATHKDPMSGVVHRSEFEIAMLVDHFMKNKIESIKERFQKTWEDTFEDDTMYEEKVDAEKEKIEKFLQDPQMKYKSESIKNKLKAEIYEKESLEG